MCEWDDGKDDTDRNRRVESEGKLQQRPPKGRTVYGTRQKQGPSVLESCTHLIDVQRKKKAKTIEMVFSRVPR